VDKHIIVKRIEKPKRYFLAWAEYRLGLFITYLLNNPYFASFAGIPSADIDEEASTGF